MRFTYYLLFTAEIRALRWTSEEVEGLNEGMRARSNLVLWNSLYPTITTHPRTEAKDGSLVH